MSTPCAAFAGTGVLAVGLLICGLNGCATAPPGGTSPEPYTAVEADNGKHITLAAGRLLNVRLPATPGSGYSWSVAALQPRVLEPAGSTLEREGELQPGASATQVLSFRAASTGDSPLVLEYRRPWERDVPAAKTFRLDVHVR